MPPQHDGLQNFIHLLYPRLWVPRSHDAQQELTKCGLGVKRRVLEEQYVGEQVLKGAVERSASHNPPGLSLRTQLSSLYLTAQIMQ